MAHDTRTEIVKHLCVIFVTCNMYIFVDWPVDMVWTLLHNTQQCSVHVLTSFVSGSKICILPMTSLVNNRCILCGD